MQRGVPDAQSASSWGCELKLIQKIKHIKKVTSASSWGCELKYDCKSVQMQMNCVSLFVRLWVEIIDDITLLNQMNVSLFVRLWVEIWGAGLLSPDDPRQPLREAVSWNVIVSILLSAADCQPLREVVSWNEYLEIRDITDEESASSWGCELKLNGRTKQ